MYSPELARLARLWDDRQGRCLERPDKIFNFALGAGAKVPSFAELVLYDDVVCILEPFEGGTIGRGKGVLERPNACIKPKLDAMDEGWVPVQEVEAL
jgi:hypothetical protein